MGLRFFLNSVYKQIIILHGPENNQCSSFLFAREKNMSSVLYQLQGKLIVNNTAPNR